MLAEIEKELCEGFERNLFVAAQKNLADKSNPLRFNNYSNAMRELTRHVLHRLAPDDYVISCPWYKNETDKEKGITRKQRAYYAVQGGLENSYVEKTLGLEVEDIHSRLVKAINSLSKFTHIEAKVFDLPESDIEALVNETTESVYGFLTTIRDCQKMIIDSLWEHIDSAVIDEALRETIISIDELATHHFIDEVYTDKVEIYEINHESIEFRVYGSIGCELQWGSNSDLRRGDGAVLPQSYPFVCELISPVYAPEEVESIEDSLVVDTSSWSDVRYGQDEQA
jgi:predicted pPIWI-associating nuclease